MFAYGTRVEGLCPYDIDKYKDLYTGDSSSIFESPFMVKIKTETLLKYPASGALQPLIIFGTIWSDGFDSNNVVHTAPSMQIRTITISPPCNMSTSIYHTFIINKRREGNCHEQVKRDIKDELLSLEKDLDFTFPF